MGNLDSAFQQSGTPESPEAGRRTEILQMATVAGAREGHTNWLKNRLSRRNRFGFVRNDKEGIHPALLPYDLIMDIAGDSIIKHLEIDRSISDSVKKKEILKRLTELLNNLLPKLTEEDRQLLTSNLFDNESKSYIFPDATLDVILPWIKEIREKWSTANDMWGQDALAFYESRSPLIKANAIEATDPDTLLEQMQSFLNELRLETIVQGRFLGLLNQLKNNPQLFLLLSTAHSTWRRKTFPNVDFERDIAESEVFENLMQIFERLGDSLSPHLDAWDKMEETYIASGEMTREEILRAKVKYFKRILGSVAAPQRFNDKLSYFPNFSLIMEEMSIKLRVHVAAWESIQETFKISGEKTEEEILQDKIQYFNNIVRSAFHNDPSIDASQSFLLIFCIAQYFIDCGQPEGAQEMLQQISYDANPGIISALKVIEEEVAKS